MPGLQPRCLLEEGGATQYSGEEIDRSESQIKTMKKFGIAPEK